MSICKTRRKKINHLSICLYNTYMHTCIHTHISMHVSMQVCISTVEDNLKLGMFHLVPCVFEKIISFTIWKYLLVFVIIFTMLNLWKTSLVQYYVSNGFFKSIGVENRIYLKIFNESLIWQRDREMTPMWNLEWGKWLFIYITVSLVFEQSLGLSSTCWHKIWFDRYIS